MWLEHSGHLDIVRRGKGGASFPKRKRMEMSVINGKSSNWRDIISSVSQGTHIIHFQNMAGLAGFSQGWH